MFKTGLHVHSSPLFQVKKKIDLFLFSAFFLFAGCELDSLKGNFDSDVPPAKLTISPSEPFSVEVGSVTNLGYQLTGSEDYAGIRFSSQSPSIAAVTKYGVLTAMETGRTVITVTHSALKLNASVEVTVKRTQESPSITVFPNEIRLDEDSTRQISVQVQNTSDARIRFSSMNSAVATVSQTGLVTGSSAGTTTVRVALVAQPTIFQDVTVTVIPFDPVPPEAYVKTGKVVHPTPPAGYTAVLGWANIVHDRRLTGSSKIEVDYFRLYALVDGQPVLLAADEFNNTSVSGALWTRDSWFATQTQGYLSAQFDNGVMTLPLSTHPDEVWHFWNSIWPRPLVPAGTTKIYVEMRFRITGPGCLQIGWDYYLKPGSLMVDGPNIEGAASDWYFESADFQTRTWPN